MAEPKEDVAQEATPKKGSLIRKLAVVLGVILTFAIMGLLVFKFVVQPRLTTKPPEETQAGPLNTVSVSFDDAYVNLIMPSKDMLASTLSYKVTFDCSNQETAGLVTTFKPRFIAMLRKVHSYKTRAEMDDPLVEESIRKQALQEANALLQEVEGADKPDNRIVAVYHEKFFVSEM